MRPKNVLIPVVIGLLLLAACGNDSSSEGGDTSSSTTEADSGTDSSTEPDTSQTTSSDDDTESSSSTGDWEATLAELDATDDYCAALNVMVDSTQSLSFETMTPEDMEQFLKFTEKALGRLAEIAPAELKADYEIGLSVYPEYLAAAEAGGYELSALLSDEVTSILEDGEAGESADRVEQYDTETCGAVR